MTSIKHFHVVWCDDLRQEVGNKISFMGVYTGHLIVPQLPFVLPKLCAWGTISIGKDHPFVRKFSGRVRLNDGTVLFEIPEQIREAPPTLPAKIDDPRITLINFAVGVQLAPVPIPENAEYIEMLIDADELSLASNKLWIEASGEAYASSFGMSGAPKEAEATSRSP